MEVCFPVFLSHLVMIMMAIIMRIVILVERMEMMLRVAMTTM